MRTATSYEVVVVTETRGYRDLNSGLDRRTQCRFDQETESGGSGGGDTVHQERGRPKEKSVVLEGASETKRPE